MKSTIVEIHDISDIDTSKISVYDLNNRYVDSNGNIYGLKFDYNLKKIKIVHIIRSRNEDAPLIRHQILMRRLHTVPEVNIKQPEYENVDEVESENEFFNPSMVIKGVLDEIESHKARLKGIVMNMKNSYLLSKDNKNENKELEEIFRNIDMDGILQLEKMEAYEKELTMYPRSIIYYQSKVDNQARAIIEQLSGDNARIRNFIHSYEMSNSLRHTYGNLHKILVKLANFIKEIDFEETPNVSPSEEQAFNDAQISLTNTIMEIDIILEKLEPFDEYLKHAGNF